MTFVEIGVKARPKSIPEKDDRQCAGCDESLFLGIVGLISTIARCESQ